MIFGNLCVAEGPQDTVRLALNTPADGAVFTKQEVSRLIGVLQSYASGAEIEDDDLAQIQGYQNRRTQGGREDFPTPPWATRAFLHHVLPQDHAAEVVWEPAANRGHMARALAEKFGTVVATDLHDYGAGYPAVDFLSGPTPKDYGQEVHWIITNPPFNLAEEFVERALTIATEGVAVFVRASWIEGKGRYERLFKRQGPELFCPYVERVPIVEGRVDPKAASQMSYAWFVWRQGKPEHARTRVVWIPPSRGEMERSEDYGA
jgi:hypothetical protein